MQLKVIPLLIHLFISLLLIGCKPVHHVSQEIHPAVKISAQLSTGEDAQVEALIDPYRAPLLARMNEVIAATDSSAVKALPESSLGNLVCDLLLQYGNENGYVADCCFLNSGGLRVELPKGEVTRSMLYELMPFENTIVVVRLKGDQLLMILNQIAARGGGPVSGINMGIKGGEAFQPVINNKPLDNNKIYSVLSSDYLVAGGDKYIIPQPLETIQTSVLLRDALISKFQDFNKINTLIKPRTDGRLYIVDTP